MEKGLKVVVFGGAGFLGSHVADELSKRGYQVCIYDRISSPYLRSDQAMIVGDILDEKRVEQAVMGADIVYNFIAIADLDEAEISAIETTRINVLGNVIVLEACRKAKVKHYIFSSSIYVYSDAGSFYRCSKQSSEIFIENYQKVYGLDYTILRYGSLYGPRSDETNWIYQMLKQALTEKVIVRQGDGEEMREYIHVLDAARLSLEILKPDYRNKNVIIAGREQIKINDLLTMVREILRSQVEIKYIPTKDKMHYEITPYIFNPKLAVKIHSNEHIDLGQGILDMLSHLHAAYMDKPIIPIQVSKNDR